MPQALEAGQLEPQQGLMLAQSGAVAVEVLALLLEALLQEALRFTKQLVLVVVLVVALVLEVRLEHLEAVEVVAMLVPDQLQAQVVLVVLASSLLSTPSAAVTY